MNKVFKDFFTESDGVSFCTARFLWIIGALAFIAMALYAITHGKDINLQDFGLGYTGILAGGGAGVALKGKAE